MSASLSAPIPAEASATEESFTAVVLAHLDAQLSSVRRLLEIVLEQGAAIRERDVHTVVRLAGLLQGELSRRQQIEHARLLLLERAGVRLGVGAKEVTLSRLREIMDPAGAELAAVRSAELRGLLNELRREHSCNRAIMRIELSFLDHLMKSLALDNGVHGYDLRGSTSTEGGARQHGALGLLDLQA